MMLRILAVAVLVTVAGLAVAAAGYPQADERLVRIETGLLPPINWKGEARATMALRERMAYYQAPGVSLAVLDKGTLVCARAWGVARAGGAQAVTPDTMFQAGSVSKTVAALLALHLASAGRFRVDDPVNAHLKEWKLPDSESGGAQPVLIRHLLSHSAGLTPNTYRGVPPDSPFPATLDLLQGKGSEGIRPVARVAPPGQRFAYSNTAFLVLEQLLADVGGRPFAELARLRLFGPLGMSSSTFAPGPPPPLFDRAAWGHDAQQQPTVFKGPAVPAAVGGLWTTPSDLARLLAAFFASYRGSARALLTQALAREAMQPQVEGQGLVAPVEGTRQASRLAQMGAMPGFVSYLVGYPELGQGAVIMINAGGRTGSLALELARAVAAEYAWPGYVPEFERVTQSADVLEAFAGQYEFADPSLPKIRVTRQGDRLLWQDREMIPVRGGTFVVPSAGIEVGFVRDAAGAVVAAEYAQPGMRRTRIARTGAPAGFRASMRTNSPGGARQSRWSSGSQ